MKNVLAHTGYCNERDLQELVERDIDLHVALAQEGKANGSWRSVTPLHQAGENTTNPRVLEALLAVGVDPNGRGRRPVSEVRWEDAWQYVDCLTEHTGEEYRLPSEAEWESVARAGTRTAGYWGDGTREQCQYANGDNSVGCRDRQEHTAPVRLRGSPSDGSPWHLGECSRCMLCGDSESGPRLLRSTLRICNASAYRGYGVGLRVARTIR